MARHPRIEYPGAMYHITARGNERRSIFLSIEDRKHFLEVLAESLERYEVVLYGYVLMSNHYHLCIQTEHPNLSRFMHYLNTAYTVWMNTRNRRKGHLFEGRYKAIVMEEEGYLLSATGYIHLNPVRTREARGLPVSERMRIVCNYRWSSYGDYTGSGARKREPKVDCDRVWGELHARRPTEGRQRYREYVRNWLLKEEQEMRKPKRKRDMAEYEPFSATRLGCFLGGDQFRDFIQKMLTNDRELSQELVGYKNWRKEMPFAKLLDVVAEVLGVRVSGLKERHRPHQERDIAIYLCREIGEKSLREIGEAFGIKAAAVTHAVNRVKGKMKAKRRFRQMVSKSRKDIIKLLKT